MVKGVKFEFGNGEVLIVPPLTLGAIQLLESNHGKMSTWGGNMDTGFILEVAGSSLRRNYPEITDEKIMNELLDISNMNEIVSAIMDVGGAIRKAQEQGEMKPVEV